MLLPSRCPPLPPAPTALGGHFAALALCLGRGRGCGRHRALAASGGPVGLSGEAPGHLPLGDALLCGGMERVGPIVPPRERIAHISTEERGHGLSVRLRLPGRGAAGAGGLLGPSGSLDASGLAGFGDTSLAPTSIAPVLRARPYAPYYPLPGPRRRVEPRALFDLLLSLSGERGKPWVALPGHCTC